MKCESCGAEYRLKDVRCPFCQSENPVLAEMRREQTLSQYDREAQQMKDTVPDKVIKKWTGLLLTVCVILVALALLTGLVMYAGGPIRAKIDYRIYRQRQQELEELLSAGDIEGICEYMRGGDFRSYEYLKFQEIESVYRYYRDFQDYQEYLDVYRDAEYRSVRDEGKLREEIESYGYASSLVSYGSRLLRSCRQYSGDRTIRGNEELFARYDREIRDRFQELGISGQLLEWLSLEQDEDKQGDERFEQAVQRVIDAYLEP